MRFRSESAVFKFLRRSVDGDLHVILVGKKNMMCVFLLETKPIYFYQVRNNCATQRDSLSK